MMKVENKFSLSADKLDEVVVLGNILTMEDARQPLFASKPNVAGNSNNQMSKWRKKDKFVDKDKEKQMANFNKHMQ
jgi:hypothetical protein